MDLNGKIVLVAGGAGGIGLGIAKALAAEGCRVALADVNEEALISAVKAKGADSAFVWRACDITQREQVSQLFQWLGDELGAIDILVNSVREVRDLSSILCLWRANARCFWQVCRIACRSLPRVPLGLLSTSRSAQTVSR
jgi:NAD(P)-dependent dehydrogenase (short-subunit alcohol dehydrogenase family)